MQEPSTDVFDWLVKGIVGVLTWISVRLHNRVDSLEKERATTSEMKDLERKMDAHMAENRKAFDGQNVILLQIMGRLPRDNNHS